MESLETVAEHLWMKLEDVIERHELPLKYDYPLCEHILKYQPDVDTENFTTLHEWLRVHIKMTSKYCGKHQAYHFKTDFEVKNPLLVGLEEQQPRYRCTRE